MSQVDPYEHYNPSSRCETPMSAVSATDHFEYVDRPLALVTVDPGTKRFQVTEEALEFFKSLQAPIGIIAVAGLYRTGKSYLLNRIILNRKTGFGVGPTVNPCTKGLWVWGRPISATTAEGEPYNIIVVDSEGIGALDADTDHDSRIFSLAILISSFFIYNSVGSIDEQALQNLSFVVNLTKHIHIKSQHSDDPDAEEFAAYFPAFMWIVRDFTLQLVSSEGDPIPAKEYLESALKAQRGFTDAIEDKNRIRRLLTSFFKDRDCFTMVRPVGKEEDLHRITDLELSDLRSEFVEQILVLRRKIINKVKPKTMNGKVLSGQMIANLLEAYVKAINQGAVPSIESAWSYICKAENGKALQEALDVYEKIMESSVTDRIPMAEEELRLFHKEAKESAVEHFTHKAVGSEKDALLRSLAVQLSEKYAIYKEENTREASDQITSFLSEAFNMIDRRLTNGGFKSLVEYEREVKALKTVFLDQGPQGPKRRELMAEFCEAKLSEASDYFLKNVTNELELTQQLTADNYSRLESELRETKEELIKVRDSFQRKLTAIESEKAESAALAQSLKDQVAHLRSERERVEKELREAQKQVKVEMTRQVEEAIAKSSQSEESMKELEHRLFQGESEHQQEKALLQQKISFLEKSLEESSKREKDYLSELKVQKSSHNQALKDMSQKHESALKNYQFKFENEMDKAGELDKSLAEKEAMLEALRAQWEETEKLQNEKVAELQVLLVNARKQTDLKEAESKQRFAEYSKEQESSLSRLKARTDETEKKLKQTEDVYKTEQAQWLRTNAVLQQKLDFSEMQCKELRTQWEDVKKQNEALGRELQAATASDGTEELQTQMQRLRDQHAAEGREWESKMEDCRKAHSLQVEELMEKTNALELKLKLDCNEWTYKEKQFTEKIDALQDEKAKLAERAKALAAENTLLSEEGAAKLKQRIRQLEAQIEETNAKCSREIMQINAKSEESLQQLKNFYELEKERLENRIAEEKTKAESRYTFMVEEYEQKIREDADLAGEQRQDLEDQLEEWETVYNNDTTQLKQQIELDAQKIETLEKHLKETKDNLASIHTSHALAVEQQLENFNRERAMLLEKVERLASETATKDKELATVTYKKEQLESLLAFKEKELEENKTDFALERSSLSEKLEDVKTKLRAVSDESAKKRSEFMKENALACQQIEFHTKKIAELTKIKEEMEKKHAEALLSLKEEKAKEAAEAVEKLTGEREALEKKLEMKRRALKQTEASYAKQLAAVEKERAVTSEKLNNQEIKFAELESRLNQEIAQLKSQLKDRSGDDDSEKIALQLENERLKTLSTDQEKQLSEKIASYERDRTLWENKFAFLTTQKEQSRTELIEAQKKFEGMVEEIKKKSQAEKDKMEQNFSQLLTSTESRYSSQLKDLQGSTSVRIAELTEKNKALERDYRTTKEQLEVERRNRSADSGTREERLQNLLETEQRLLSEIDTLKKDRDRRVNELQEAFQQEKDEWKGKMIEAERRVKEMEQQRGQLFLEHEKERARWMMDRDHLTSQKNEAQENVVRMQKRNETLLKENEKLRAERPGKLRNAGTLGKKEGKGVNILGASISFQDYLASSQGGGTPEGQRTSGGVSHEGSSSGKSTDLSPRSSQRLQALPRAGSPHSRKPGAKPSEPSFAIGRPPQ